MGLEAKAIEFTELAQLQLQTITDHIFKQFGEASTEKFLNSLESKLQLVSHGKVVHRYFSRQKHIRYFIANKKNAVLYLEAKKSIQVIGIYNLRQDLNHLKD